jgi:hypothetical protein
MWITQSVMRPIHKDAFHEKIKAARANWGAIDNPVSNHFLNWAISKYDDAILKFAIGIRLNTLKTPRTTKRDSSRDIQCCWCDELNPDMAHIMCNCRQKGWSFINKRHRAIVDAVKSAIRKGYPGVRIADDECVGRLCAEMTDEEGALKRPDLMYETFITKKGKTKKIFNMTEITSPWSWKDSLQEAYNKKVRKYETVRAAFQSKHPDIYDEVRLNIIVVSPSGVFPMQSQKDFAVATGLKRGDLAAHARCVVDAAITSAFEHYGAYCRALGFRDNVLGAATPYTNIELEFQEEARDMVVVDSIRDYEAVEDPQAGEEGGTIIREEVAISMIELHNAGKLEQDVCELTGNPRRAPIRHPDGLKQDGDDGKSDIFGKAYTKVRKVVPNAGRLNYIRTEPLPVITGDAEEVEVYFAFQGTYSRVMVSSEATQEQIERTGG